MSEPAYNPDPAGWSQGESGKVIPLPTREHVCDPASGEILSPADAQHRLSAQRDEIEALTKALGKAYALNTRLATERDQLKEARAEEEAGEDAPVIRELVRWHYKAVGRKTVKKKIPLGGVDAVIVRHLLTECDFTKEDIARASWGFAHDRWHQEKGMTSIHAMSMTKVDVPGKRYQRKILDDEKVWRWVQAGKKLRGEAA